MDPVAAEAAAAYRSQQAVREDAWAAGARASSAAADSRSNADRIAHLEEQLDLLRRHVGVLDARLEVLQRRVDSRSG